MSKIPYEDWKEQVLDGVVKEFGVSRDILTEDGLPEMWGMGMTVEEALDEITQEVLRQAEQDYQGAKP